MMSLQTRIILSGGALLLGMNIACGSPPKNEESTPAVTQTDAGSTTDSGVDSGTPPIDAGTPDAGVADAGSTDAGMPDAGPAFDAGVTLGTYSDVQVLELGTYKTNSQGLTPEISIDVSSNAASLTLVAIPDFRNSSVQIQQLRNPNSAVLALADDHFSHKSRSAQSFGIQSTMVPESADYQALFVPGRYAFRVKVGRSNGVLSQPTPANNASVRVIAFEKTILNASNYKLDINLYFTGAAGVDATAAQTNERVQNALIEMRQLYAQANIEIGEVRYFDTAPGFTDPVGLFPTTSSTKPTFADLFRQSANGPAGLNLFFVESLDVFGFGAGFSGVLGVSGGIPGPGPVIGSDRSGAVVLFDTDTWTPMTGEGGQVIDKDFLGVVMAHEGGHFLGLSHTYENLGNLADNLSDTPIQGAPDADSYLMQPGATENGGIISPLQSLTLQRNPLVQYLP